MTKKEKEMVKEINIPDNVEVTFENKNLTIKGKNGSISRRFSHPKIELKVKNNNIQLKCKKPRRKDKALLNTYVAHIKNMIEGVTEGFECKMKVVFSHFPIKTSVEDDRFVIENFLGERSARKAKILDGVKVEVKSDNVSVKGIDKEKVGQTVANIERTSAVKRRDIRIFQDGVYRLDKGGK